MSKYEDIHYRDRIAVEMAKSVPIPVDYMGLTETEKSYQQWAAKCYKMAEVLIKKGRCS